jgi:hypothetical protein
MPDWTGLVYDKRVGCTVLSSSISRMSSSSDPSAIVGTTATEYPRCWGKDLDLRLELAMVNN